LFPALKLIEIPFFRILVSGPEILMIFPLSDFFSRGEETAIEAYAPVCDT
jgi:hypothetical protein